MSRKIKNIVFHAISGLAVLVCSVILLFLIGVIVVNGIHAVDWAFLTRASRQFGAKGGVFYQVIGSVLLVTGAAIICLVLALGTSIYKSEFLHNERAQRLFDILIYGLNGVPSIIFGVFGLIFFVNLLGTGISWLVGSIILAFMMLPTVVLTTYQSMNSIPAIYRESALSLGLPRWKVILKVVLPQGLNGTVTGLLLGLARAVGETAPIMFIATAFSGVGVPQSFFQPVSALPTHILTLSQQANNPQALENAWGASFILIGLVLIFSTLALMTRLRRQTVRA